ncbi:MAG: cytochrome c biogenesis protein CcdA [Actinomycetota bacterium]|nr:cytochrome c biogenesis protein CcdA [Actinomycetota bacterium]
MNAPLALAFTAGLVATVNPCGIAMLPAYLSYFLRLSDDDPSDARGDTNVARALTVGSVVSTGFLAVFGFAGLLVTLGLQQVVSVIPWAALVVGVAIGLLGMAMLLGYELTLNLPKLRGGTSGRRYSGVFAFGVSYAVASLSCTLPIFLAVVAGVIPNVSLVAGVAVFLVYGLGMSLVVVLLTLAIALGRRSMVQRIRNSARHVNRVSGGILVLAGSYIVYFWATNLTRGALGASSAVLLVEQASARLTNLIGNAPLVWGLGLGGVVAAALFYTLWSSRRRDP